jgi:hypothetical protein
MAPPYLYTYFIKNVIYSHILRSKITFKKKLVLPTRLRGLKW